MRSVNHRFLDICCYQPEALKFLELPIREQLNKKFSQRKFNIHVHINAIYNDAQSLHFNHSLAEHLSKTLHKIDKLLYSAAPVNAIDILKWPGALEDTIIEPEVIQPIILQRCNKIIAIIKQVQQQFPNIMAKHQSRLQQHFSELQIEVEPERLEQEMFILVQKSDIAEELDRLSTHIHEVQLLLSKDTAMGRKLDFIMQEMNREANILGSKATDINVTQAAVELKVLIEQMREQIQNIE